MMPRPQIPSSSNDATSRTSSIQLSTTANSLQQVSPTAVEDTATDLITRFRTHQHMEKVTLFLVDKTTLLFAFPSLVVISAALITVAVFQPRSPACNITPSIDDNLFSTASQASLTLLSIYLTVLPIRRNRSPHIRYPFWFRLSLVVRVVMSFAATAVYPFQWQISAVFGYIAGLAQVTAPLQLMRCVEEAANAGSIGHLEPRKGRV